MTLLIVLAVLAVVGLLVLFRLRRARTPALSASARARDDVRFTVYRPARVEAERWYELLVYAHRAEGPTGESGWQPDLSDAVRREAMKALGDAAPSYRTATEDAAQPVVRDTQLEFVPEIEGFQFNPPRIVVDWVEELHRAHFRMKADGQLDAATARGQLTIFNGPLILAQLTLVIHVAAAGESEEPVRGVMTPYRRVFASYARTDTDVVQRVREYARALGDEYLIDVAAIRAGEQWEPRIEQLIAQADVFQLFWSWNAIASEYVQREWRYALSLGRANFIRPVFWEDPLPQAPDRGLPPPELRTVHFQRVRIGARERGAGPSTIELPLRTTIPRAPGSAQVGSSQPGSAQPASAAPRRRRTRLPGLATAAMLVLALGSIGIYQFGMLESSPSATPGPSDTEVVGGIGNTVDPLPAPPPPPPPPPPPAPPTMTTAPPSEPSSGAIMLGAFEASASDTALVRLANDLRRGVVSAWNVSRIVAAPAGADPMAEARAAGIDVVITGIVRATADGVRVDAALTDTRTGLTREARPIVVAQDTPFPVLVRLVVEALEGIGR